MTSQANPYLMAKPDSLAVRIIARARRRIYARFLAISRIQPEETLLDVGATAASDYESFNFIEAWYPHKNRITAVGLDDASYLETAYPGVTFLQADGLKLPFPDQSFDVVHCHAVIEHVGNSEQQKQLVSELWRVARRGVFITTPNRWHPVEFHTLLPLIHWLPKRFFRTLLRRTRYDFYSHEGHLNLLGTSDLQRLMPPGCSFRIFHTLFLGFPSNLLVWMDKKCSASQQKTPAH